MTKRDEMAAAFVKKKSFSFHPDEKARHEDVYKAAWNAAVQHDERVLALVEALEFCDMKWVNDNDLRELCKRGDKAALSAFAAREALTQYRESVKK